MAVFVSAANQGIALRPRSTRSTIAERERDDIFFALVAQLPVQAGFGEFERAPLQQAFNVVWEQFEGDAHQEAVCSRVLAFHFLMERTRGQVVETWLKPSPESPETVVLDDAVVAAVGSVALTDDGALLEGDLLTAIEGHLRTRMNEAETTVEAARADAPSFDPADQSSASSTLR